jgi:hypothetical protein
MDVAHVSADLGFRLALDPKGEAAPTAPINSVG